MDSSNAAPTTERKDIPYTPKQKEYLDSLNKKFKNAKDQRDIAHTEFDGMTYLQYCESNRKGANTYVEPKKNKQDTTFVSGTIRQKLFTYLAAISNLDLSPDIQAFDSQNNEIAELGEAVEDIMFEVGERDNDEEKKLLRQYTLLEQGTVFVEDPWEAKYRVVKKLTGKWDGEMNGVEWTKSTKKEYEGCTRNIVLNENVYLGDIRVFEMERQPHIFTVEVRSFAETESIYGEWEMFKHVPRTIVQSQNTQDTNTLYSPRHFFETTKKEECEIIKFQDRWGDEYAVMINGVLMTPPGLPLSAITPTGDYTLVKQVNEVISPFFAYGKSIVARMKNQTVILDEMLRMAILKTQKSMYPPLANNTGRVLSSKIYAPGTITMGIDKEKIGPLDPNARAVEGGEFNMIEMLMKSIDRNSVDPTTSGNQPQGSPTATQILEVQRQAKLMIGLTVLVCSLLEKKLAWLRLYNILYKWMEATGKEYNSYTQEWTTKYRSINREKLLPGVGIGRQMVKLTDTLPTPEQQMKEEDMMSTTKRPVRITYLVPEEIKKSKFMWFINVAPKEKKTDALNKVMFDEMMTKALTSFPNVNLAFFEEKFADIWNENPAKMFSAPQQAAPASPAGGANPNGTQPGQPNAQAMKPIANMKDVLGGTSS